MVVVASTVVQDGEPRVDGGDGGEGAGGGIGEERGVGLGDVEVLGSPEGKEGDVAVVVLAADAGGGERVPDGGRVETSRVLERRSVWAEC
jgi:hypothetical protein